MVVLVFTLVGMASGVYIVRACPTADGDAGTVLALTLVGFALGWIIVLAAGFFELARTLP